MQPDLIRRLRLFAVSLEERGSCSPSLVMGDVALAMWLVFSFQTFTNRAIPPFGALLFAGLGAAAVACFFRFSPLRPPGFAARSLGLTVVLTLAFGLTSSLFGPALTLREVLWLALCLGLLLAFFRLLFLSFRSRHQNHPLEVPRWVALGAASVALNWFYYFSGSLGSADAHWYTMMLADYLTQLRAGIFPVWLGQSEFAFNGADSPLRFAPWFQHAGGIVDCLTARSLTFNAVKNAVIVLHGLAGIGTAYICLRDILRRRPGTAALLAAIYAASPGYLAALNAGDQYMTYVTLPFVPVVLNGLWRALTHSQRRGDMLICTGLAGLWLSHAPVALWMTLLSGAVWLVAVIRFRQWTSDARRTVVMALTFAVLGGYPFLSLLSLDLKSSAGLHGAVVAEQVAAHFPANFAPVDPQADRMTTYQVGYAALLAFALALMLWIKKRDPGHGAFIVITAAIALVALPVPLINVLLWTHAPGWLIEVNNIWPTQRLFGPWAAMMLFAYAMVYGDDPLGENRSLTFLLLGIIGLATIWAGREAGKFSQYAVVGLTPASQAAAKIDARNAIMTRFAYASFDLSTAYASHGYMDPHFENRILNASDQTVMFSNANSAAPLVRTEYGSSRIPRLQQTGTLLARPQAGTSLWDLSPALILEPATRYALRLELTSPSTPGTLICTAGSVYREYLLPDSGQGIAPNDAPRSFGSTPTSTHVLSIQSLDSAPVDLKLSFQTPFHAEPGEHAFARYWLFVVELNELPIVLRSIMPYRAQVEVAVPALLETPRMWRPGYRASVNDQPILPARSAQNLVMIPLLPGKSAIELDYAPPSWLLLSYWITIAGWTFVGVTGARRFYHRLWPGRRA